MKFRLPSFVVLSFAVLTLIAFSGCCRKPPEEVGEAQAAVAQAKENCAEVYAGDEYKRAYDALSMAEKFADDRKCKDAKASAENAIQLAAEAELRANAKKAELSAQVKKGFAEFEEMAAKGQAQYNALMAKKANIDKKRSDAMKLASEKDFAKYNINMDLPTAKIDPSIETEGTELMSSLEQLKSKFENGDCNLFEVLAELQKLSDVGTKLMEKLAANDRALDELNALIEETLQTRLAELEVAMIPKYWTSRIVEKGDCLWKIAEMEMVYSDPFKWPMIWWENQWTEEKVMNMSRDDRFHLIKDPDLIFPGQNLKFKQDATADRLNEAINYARNRYGTTDWRDIPDFLTDGK